MSKATPPTKQRSRPPSRARTSWWPRSPRAARWPAPSATSTAPSRAWPTPQAHRLFVVGGYSSLRPAAGADRFVTDLSHVPAELHDEIRAGAALIIEDLPATPETLDWVFVSPALRFGAHMPGEATRPLPARRRRRGPARGRRRDLRRGLRPRVRRPDRERRPPPGTGQPRPLRALGGRSRHDRVKFGGAVGDAPGAFSSFATAPAVVVPCGEQRSVSLQVGHLV